MVKERAVEPASRRHGWWPPGSASRCHAVASATLPNGQSGTNGKTDTGLPVPVPVLPRVLLLTIVDGPGEPADGDGPGSDVNALPATARTTAEAPARATTLHR